LPSKIPNDVSNSNSYNYNNNYLDGKNILYLFNLCTCIYNWRWFLCILHMDSDFMCLRKCVILETVKRVGYLTGVKSITLKWKNVKSEFHFNIWIQDTLSTVYNVNKNLFLMKTPWQYRMVTEIWAKLHRKGVVLILIIRKWMVKFANIWKISIKYYVVKCWKADYYWCPWGSVILKSAALKCLHVKVQKVIRTHIYNIDLLVVI
jgi:hypothetical protein